MKKRKKNREREKRNGVGGFVLKTHIAFLESLEKSFHFFLKTPIKIGNRLFNLQ